MWPPCSPPPPGPPRLKNNITNFKTAFIQYCLYTKLYNTANIVCQADIDICIFTQSCTVVFIVLSQICYLTLLLCNYNTLGFIHVLECTPGTVCTLYIQYKNTVYELYITFIFMCHSELIQHCMF